MQQGKEGLKPFSTAVAKSSKRITDNGLDFCFAPSERGSGSSPLSSVNGFSFVFVGKYWQRAEL